MIYIKLITEIYRANGTSKVALKVAWTLILPLRAVMPKRQKSFIAPSPLTKDKSSWNCSSSIWNPFLVQMAKFLFWTNAEMRWGAADRQAGGQPLPKYLAFVFVGMWGGGRIGQGWTDLRTAAIMQRWIRMNFIQGSFTSLHSRRRWRWRRRWEALTTKNSGLIRG